MVTDMTEEEIGFDIHASFSIANGAKLFQAANVEHRYRVTTDDGTYERRARGVVADLAAVVPSSDMMEQVATLTASLATMTTERDTERTAKNAAQTQVASLTTERDGLAADKTALTAQIGEAQAAKTTAEASVATLTAQLAAAQAQIDTLTGVIDKGTPNTTNLLRYVGQIRAHKAASGVTVNGVAVSTDVDSLTLLAGAVQLCQLDPSTVIDWHISGNGSVELTSQQVIGLGVAVGRYVQAGFAKVAELAAGIQATPPTITTFEQIDTASWPSTTLTI